MKSIFKTFRISSRTKVKVFMSLVAFFVLLAIGGQIALCFNDHSYVVTITDKDRIVKSKSNNKSKGSNTEIESKYIVFTEDESSVSHTFENTDVFIRFKWNSSDVQGSLKINHKYKLTVIGLRIPFLSWYENILKVEEIK